MVACSDPLGVCIMSPTASPTVNDFSSKTPLELKESCERTFNTAPSLRAGEVVDLENDIPQLVRDEDAPWPQTANRDAVIIGVDKIPKDHITVRRIYPPSEVQTSF